VARVELTDDAKEDLRDLAGSTQKIILKALNKLTDSSAQRGAPLGSQPAGNLTGFRKLIIGDRDYRAVYSVLENGDVAVVSVIGKRADSEVYEMAIARLRLSSDATVRGLAEQLGGVFK